MLKKIFEITDFIDKARWHCEQNYNLINFYNNDISNDSKLLTHWLCYITDRQMEYKRIWDVGGFVFSELVEDYKNVKSTQNLNPESFDSSFFISQDNYKFIKQTNLKNSNNTGKYLFVSHQKTGQNLKLKKYFENSDISPFFISRYYPSDYKLNFRRSAKV